MGDILYKENSMEVLEIIEKEDGSCEIRLELEEEENNLLVGYAVNDILKKSIETLGNEKCKCKCS